MAGITLRECFLTETTRELSASDICPEAEPCMFTGTGKHGRISLVHGFADTDGESGLRDSTLNLFVCDFSGEAAPSNFTESEFNTLAKRCIAFI
ncbi:MAG: hypothetical protein J5494_08245, partial [Candidatus Methanomethylophilaceae archaeon]|nr:hypothetical protein [Candidatus Methanomethylophilaceae archaeon]